MTTNKPENQVSNGWSDQQLISHALNMWANYVETGNVAMSAKTARDLNEEVYTLNFRQKELVDRMRKLSTEILTDSPH